MQKGNYQSEYALISAAAVVPFGFVVLAVAGIGYLLAKRRHHVYGQMGSGTGVAKRALAVTG
jgi:hypothetical protein